jgi:hypothetical protein
MTDPPILPYEQLPATCKDYGPQLVGDYVAAKRAVLAVGVTNSPEYARRKSPFVEGVLAQS